MAVKRLFEGLMHYPSHEEIEAGFKATEDRILAEDRLDSEPEILYSPEMQTAWKALTKDQRIDVLDMLVGEGAVDNETLIAFFPRIAETSDIADFGKISYGTANMRDCPLRWAFDHETKAFTPERYRKSLAEWAADVRGLGRLIGGTP